MYFARNNTIIPLDNSNQIYVIMNPLSGNMDILNQKEYGQIISARANELDNELAAYMLERGYLFADETEEDRLIQNKWDLFQEETANTQTQLLLILSYDCNLACKYCYQAGVQEDTGLITPPAVDAFFTYVQSEFAGDRQKPFITLFGGEPLINSPRHHEIINQIVDRAVEYGYEIAAVTNGYDLIDYVDILARARVKEIQVTLDGSREMHNQRRGTANGKGTFDRIIIGIEAALQRGIPINLRSVVDLENLEDMVDLARFLDRKGWLDLPPELFKTQVGRNYELFECYAQPQYLMSEAALWKEFSRLSKKYPILKKYHRPEFKGIRHLVDTGSMYMASFDTCPAAKSEWVFDLNGDIYGCTASCGRKEFRLGTFYPQVTLEHESIKQWQARNINNIEKCKHCRYNVICGGGCGVIAANKHGAVLTHDCRPIQELLEIGVDYYREEILSLAGDSIEQAGSNTSCCQENTRADEIKTCDCHVSHTLTNNLDKHLTGCMICGEELVYRDNKQEMQCAVCGTREESVVNCKNGHYICDRCHSRDSLDLIYNLCRQTDSSDPMAILNGLFRIPRLPMHGPEYHSMVAAALVTAYCNGSGKDKIPLLDEAIARGQEIKGGSCGLQGVCGAAAGAGIAYSILQKVSPLSVTERGLAMKLTAGILNKMGEYGGPRCCKRESALAVETAAGLTGWFAGEDMETYECTQFKNNPDCIKKLCPYFPQPKKRKD